MRHITMPERPSPRDRYPSSFVRPHAVPDTGMYEFIVDDVVGLLRNRRKERDVGIEARVEEQCRVSSR